MAAKSNSNNSEGFFAFWKKYVNGWVAAALVLPTAITWKGMPLYESQRSTLTTLTSLFCGLILAFLFTSRDLITDTAKAKTRLGIARSLLIPLVLIIATAFCAFEYLGVLTDSGQYWREGLADAMKKTPIDQIHNGGIIMAFYILMILFAECAFFFMAIREWKPNQSSNSTHDTNSTPLESKPATSETTPATPEAVS